LGRGLSLSSPDFLSDVSKTSPLSRALSEKKISKPSTARRKKKKSKRIFFLVDPLLKKVDRPNSLLEAALVSGHLLPEGIFFPPIGSPAFQVRKMRNYKMLNFRILYRRGKWSYGQAVFCSL
jgi:hypothetical protein